MKYLSLLGVSMSVLPALLAGAPVQSESSSKLPVSNFGASTALEMVAVLTGVVLLILILGWLIKRVGNFPTAGKGIVKVVGGVSLGPRERAVVIEAGDKRILVGVAPGRVQTLCLLDDDISDGLVAESSSENEFSNQLDAQLQDGSK
jgi:flagellar protein FliO/FliZ